ncbi:MAG: NAD-binding protein [Pseudonocardiales bacterium]
MARSRLLSPVVRRIRAASVALLVVLAVGTGGYVVLGFTVLDAAYQTVTTVTTVGFREVRPLSSIGKIFTMVLILAGVGTALYALTQLLEAAVDGHLLEHMEARRMDRAIARMDDHVIICGWGRVGKASAVHLSATQQPVVVVDRNPDRLVDLPYPYVLGDISDDDVLRQAGIERARSLVAALDTDADNVYVTLSARALRPDLVIIARARSDESTSKLLRAGADRVVNPQLIGGRRMAAFALAPDVADFLDVVMHDESLDFRIDQIEIGPASPLQGRTIGEVALTETTGVVILALRPAASAEFVPNPSSSVRIAPHSILIAIGTPGQLDALRRHAQEPSGRS